MYDTGETLTLLSAAADVVDLNNRSREGRKGKTRGKKTQGSSLSDRAGGGEGSGEDASPPSSMRIEEEHANVAVHEYMQKYLVQPNVVLVSLSLSLPLFALFFFMGSL